ncbi:hypothetical protein [Mycobacterium arosiense]|nr:hypothetical protein [Mycobacterium arosiense]
MSISSRVFSVEIVRSLVLDFLISVFCVDESAQCVVQVGWA